MKNIKLSKNFDLIEFTKSSTAYLHAIDNTPSENITFALSFGVNNILQPLRDMLGKPIKITSGYRSPALNKAVGGSPSSQHQFGLAADFVLDTPDDYSEAIDFIRNLPFFDQLINEYKGKSRWLHVSWSLNPRHQYFTNINK